MKPVNVIFLFLLAFPLRADAVQLGGKAPAFTLNDSKGNEVNSGSLAGNVLFLNFWAPWCGSCKREMIELETLNARYAAKGVKIIGITVGSSEAAIAAFQENNRVSFPLLLDGKGSVSDAYQCSHLPTSFIIDRDGTIRYIHKGYLRESRNLYEKEITELLEQH